MVQPPRTPIPHFSMPAHLRQSYLNPSKAAARQVGILIIAGQSVNSTGEKFYMRCILGSTQTNSRDLLDQELQVKNGESEI